MVRPVRWQRLDMAHLDSIGREVDEVCRTYAELRASGGGGDGDGDAPLAKLRQSMEVRVLQLDRFAKKNEGDARVKLVEMQRLKLKKALRNEDVASTQPDYEVITTRTYDGAPESTEQDSGADGAEGNGVADGGPSDPTQQQQQQQQQQMYNQPPQAGYEYAAGHPGMAGGYPQQQQQYAPAQPYGQTGGPGGGGQPQQAPQQYYAGGPSGPGGYHPQHPAQQQQQQQQQQFYNPQFQQPQYPQPPPQQQQQQYPQMAGPPGGLYPGAGHPGYPQHPSQGPPRGPSGPQRGDGSPTGYPTGGGYATTSRSAVREYLVKLTAEQYEELMARRSQLTREQSPLLPFAVHPFLRKRTGRLAYTKNKKAPETQTNDDSGYLMSQGPYVDQVWLDSYMRKEDKSRWVAPQGFKTVVKPHNGRPVNPK